MTKTVIGLAIAATVLVTGCVTTPHGGSGTPPSNGLVVKITDRNGNVTEVSAAHFVLGLAAPGEELFVDDGAMSLQIPWANIKRVAFEGMRADKKHMATVTLQNGETRSYSVSEMSITGETTAGRCQINVRDIAEIENISDASPH
jgi:hypothetical protein